MLKSAGGNVISGRRDFDEGFLVLSVSPVGVS